MEHGDPALPMGHQDVVLQRADRLVRLELRALIVLFRRIAGDLEQDGGVEGGGARTRGMLLQLAADDGAIGKRGQARSLHVDPQIRSVHPTRLVGHRVSQQPQDFGRQGRVVFRSAGHRIDLTVEKLVLGRAALLQRDVVGVRVAVQRASGRHGSIASIASRFQRGRSSPSESLRACSCSPGPRTLSSAQCPATPPSRHNRCLPHAADRSRPRPP